ncbi:hypothetical protein HJC23_011730 [Cyclotella cryptica]|uniref:Uncharacterized protein n=1 Tax=Cyclotella cryptica TaxID=29204 RepID=A0ABD3NIV1_9STRA
MLLEDSGSSAPSLPQVPVPLEIEATHHDVLLLHAADTSPDASASVTADDATVSAPPATEDAIVPGITDDATQATASALPEHQDGIIASKQKQIRSQIH